MSKCAIHTCAKGVCNGASDPGCVPSCMHDRCLGLAAVCTVAPVTVGTAHCKDITACLPTCGSSVSCLQGCVAASRWTGQLAFAKLWGCLATSDAKDPQNDCYAAALACGADGIESDHDCYSLLQCSGGCSAGVSVGRHEHAPT